MRYHHTKSDSYSRMTRLRARLLESSLPQWEIAARVGVSPATLSQYAMGRRYAPIEKLHRLSIILDVPVEQLMGIVQPDDLDQRKTELAAQRERLESLKRKVVRAQRAKRRAERQQSSQSKGRS